MKDSTKNYTELLEHRENLIRALRLAVGYVKTAAQTDPNAARHAAEIERTLSKTIVPANAVLKKLGNKITKLRKLLQDIRKELDLQRDGRKNELIDDIDEVLDV